MTAPSGIARWVHDPFKVVALTTAVSAVRRRVAARDLLIAVVKSDTSDGLSWDVMTFAILAALTLAASPDSISPAALARAGTAPMACARRKSSDTVRRLGRRRVPASLGRRVRFFHLELRRRLAAPQAVGRACPFENLGADALYGHAFERQREQDWEASLALWNRVLVESPRDVRAAQERADVLIRLGRFEDASTRTPAPSSSSPTTR